ncbi:cytochrome P450 [Pseudonocardia sp. N23]|uniref:cytochrome P450 n=1 Tax=Pseudonocardia sp. N23 TaxID=1987376 RepID=UPI000BFE14ED|nr:cytochrome P450 [Pseudonocardia sp. N23]GAY07563.1 putative cytochrome P450 hydroxylase [Pseudonocardia sp. N23]
MVASERAAFNPLAPGSLEEVRRGLADARESGCPVTRVAPGLGFVSHHRYAREALLDHATFSNHGNFVLDGDGDGPAPPDLITQSDPPEHTRLRALLRPGFTRAAITDAVPWVAEYVDELIDGLPDGGPADIVGDVALPLTARVIGRLVGVPADDAAELARLSLEITAILPASFVGTPMWARLEEYLTAAARQRRAADAPPDDLVTLLALGEIDGRRLTDQEVAFHAWQLFVAGLESTAYTIGSTVWQLLDDRSRWETLLADRSLLDNAREEGLRHGSAIRWVLRTVTGPTDVDGDDMAADDRLIVGLESANMDEAVFGPDAADFDLRRPTARRHLSFGHGTHLCLGAELSRIEISTALGALLDRLPGLRLAPGAAYVDVASPMFCGPRSVDVVW